MEHSTEILYNKTEVYCSSVHRFGSDALLLARFCPPKRGQKAADLCSGCGIVSLEWHDSGHRGPCTALELQPEASALLAEAVAAQGPELAHITPVRADGGDVGKLRALRGHGFRQQGAGLRLQLQGRAGAPVAAVVPLQADNAATRTQVGCFLAAFGRAEPGQQ